MGTHSASSGIQSKISKPVKTGYRVVNVRLAAQLQGATATKVTGHDLRDANVGTTD